MALASQPTERFIVQPVATRDAWLEFYAAACPPTFLQTWAWGEFHRRQGNRVFPLGIWEEGRLVGIALTVLIAARRGRFLFVPHGPVLADPPQTAGLSAFVDALRALGRSEGASFLRISSLLPASPEYEQTFRRLGFRPAPIHMHPELAWKLDLAPDPPQLLQRMRKTTRYLIRRSQTIGIRITCGRSDDDFKNFLQLYRTTAGRQRFVGFSEPYLRDELVAFGDEARIFTAWFEGQPVASALVITAGNSAFYHHGASLPLGSRTPAAYLLQWEAILDSKRRGLRWYNFWGIAPLDQPHHPWAGLSQFKIGFGGFSEAYLPAQDCVLNHRYWINYMVERFRRVRRGL